MAFAKTTETIFNCSVVLEVYYNENAYYIFTCSRVQMYSKTRPCRAITKTSAHNLFPYEQAFKSTWVKCLASNKHGLMTSWSIFFSLNVVRTIVFPFKDLLRVASRSRLKVGKKSNWRGEGEQQHSWLNLQPRPCAFTYFSEVDTKWIVFAGGLLHFVIYFTPSAELWVARIYVAMLL